MIGDREEAAKVLLGAGWDLERVARLLRPSRWVEMFPQIDTTLTADDMRELSRPDECKFAWPDDRGFAWPDDRGFGASPQKVKYTLNQAEVDEIRAEMQREVDRYSFPRIQTNQEAQVERDITRKDLPWSSKR